MKIYFQATEQHNILSLAIVYIFKNAQTANGTNLT